VKAVGKSEYTRPGKAIEGINAILDQIDYVSIRNRRNIYIRLHHEATTISHQHGRGISFTDMLVLLAHHKLIVDRDALILRDLVVRTEENKLVADHVNLDRVGSLLRMISHRRRFLAHKARARLMKMEQQDIPSIVVDVPVTPPLRTRDIAAGLDSPATAFESPSAGTTFRSLDVSFMTDPTSGSGLQRSRRASDISMLSSMDVSKDASQTIEDDPQYVLSSMENSPWGDLMQEAAEQEH